MKGSQFKGIAGLEGSIPFGAIVTLGVKGRRGNPERTDRFFISSTGYEDVVKGAKAGGWRNQRHPLHPAFKSYNDHKDDHVEVRILRGNLAFQDAADCYHTQLAAQQLGGKGAAPGGGIRDTPPRSIPACTGDGTRAERFNGLDGDGKPTFVSITCPHRLCVFRQGAKKTCGPLGRLYFLPRWPNGDLPSFLVRYQTHGWDTCENMKGLFDSVEQIADGLGMERRSWGFAGLPFEMNVSVKKIPDKKTIDSKGVERTGVSFPVVSFAVENVVDFLSWQVEKLKFLHDAPRSVALIGDGMDHEEGSMEGVAEALSALTPSAGIPAVFEATNCSTNNSNPKLDPVGLEDPIEPFESTDIKRMLRARRLTAGAVKDIFEGLPMLRPDDVSAAIESLPFKHLEDFKIAVEEFPIKGASDLIDEEQKRSLLDALGKHGLGFSQVVHFMEEAGENEEARARWSESPKAIKDWPAARTVELEVAIEACAKAKETA